MLSGGGAAAASSSSSSSSSSSGGGGWRSRSLFSGLRRSGGKAVAVDRSNSSSIADSQEGGSVIRRPAGTPSGLHPQHRPAQALPQRQLAVDAPLDDLAAAKGMLSPPIIITLPVASGAGRMGEAVSEEGEEEEDAVAASARRRWWPSWLLLRRPRAEKKGEEGGVDVGEDSGRGHHQQPPQQQQHEEHEVLADEVVNNLEHAKKAMAYQAAFIKSFGLSQLLQYFQINATVLSIRVDWPPAVQRLVAIFRVLFVFDFHIFHVRS